MNHPTIEYYKNITLDNLQVIQEQVRGIIPPKYDIFPGLIYIPNNKELFLSIPELSLVINSLGLWDHINAIAVNTFWKITSPIHHDSGDIRYSLNIPLRGFAGTYLEFFQTEQEPTTKITSNRSGSKLNSTYFNYDIDSCLLAERVPTDTSIIVDVKQPHRFVNPFNEKRSMLLIRLNDCPEVNDIVAAL